MTGSVLDVVLVVMLLLYALTGYRQGILLSTLSLVGFLGGGALGHVAAAVGARQRRLGHGPRGHPGRRARRPRLHVRVGGAGDRRARRQPAALAGAGPARPRRSTPAWAPSPRSSPCRSSCGSSPAPCGRRRPGALGRAIGESRVLATIDAVVPAAAGQLFAGFRSLLDRNGIPKVFGGLSPEPIQPGRAAQLHDRVDAGGAGGRAARSCGSPASPRRAAGAGGHGLGRLSRQGRHQRPRRGGHARASVQVQGVGREYAASIVALRPPARPRRARRSPTCRRRRSAGWRPQPRRRGGRGRVPPRRPLPPRRGPAAPHHRRHRLRHLRPARRDPPDLLALHPRRAGQQRRTAVRPARGRSSGSSSPSRSTTPPRGMR